MEIKISVIIPVFNAERFIEKAVNSVLIQPEVDEILLIDDGSKDRSCEIIQRLASERDIIKVLTHPGRVNKGSAATRNLGILNAKNEWIAFLDADDYYLKDRFKSDIIQIQQDDSIDGIYCSCGVETIEIKNGIEKKKIEENVIGFWEYISHKELFFNFSPVGNKGRFNTNSILVKKKKVIECGMFDENMRIGEDLLLYLKLSIAARLVKSKVEKPLAIRTKHDENVTLEANNNYYKYLLKVFSKLLLWKHVNKKRKHDKIIISKILYFSNLPKCGLLILSFKMILIRPSYLFSSYFFNNIKHLLR